MSTGPNEYAARKRRADRTVSGASNQLSLLLRAAAVISVPASSYFKNRSIGNRARTSEDDL
jgi:hypothetical protein